MPALELTFDMRRPSWVSVPHADYYQAALDICAWADERRFQAVSLGEHHTTDDDYLPSPVMMAMAIAARTRSIQLRMIILAPFYNIVRLAEDLHVLELVSKGRALPVISGGYRPAEFDMYGLRLEDRLGVMLETIEFLKKAGMNQPFDYRGRRIEVVSPVVNQPMRVLMGGSYPAVIRKAAHSLADGCRPGEINLYHHYREELAKIGKPDPGPGPEKYGPTFLYVTRNPDKAWPLLAPHINHWVQSYAQYAKERAARGGDLKINYNYKPDTDLEAMRKNSNYQVVTPEQCLELAATFGPGDVLRFAPIAGGLDPKLAWESLNLFDKEVLPHLDVQFNPRLLF